MQLSKHRRLTRAQFLSLETPPKRLAFSKEFYKFVPCPPIHLYTFSMERTGACALPLPPQCCTYLLHNLSILEHMLLIKQTHFRSFDFISTPTSLLYFFILFFKYCAARICTVAREEKEGAGDGKKRGRGDGKEHGKGRWERVGKRVGKMGEER